MSAASLTSTCAVCGAEESLDSIILRLIDDDQVRRLIADVMNKSLPLGGLVVRYLRLHKPAKQRLRMERVAQVLGELVPDLQRGFITRKHREWQAPAEAWKLALQSVFDAAEKRTLTLPLDGNAYLYEILMRMADKAEATAERDQQQAAKHRSTPPSPAASVGAASAAMQPMHNAIAAEAAPTRPSVAPGTSYTVRQMKAQLEARKRLQQPPPDSPEA